MDRILSFVREHPYITGGTAIAVLLVLFWPRSTANNSSQADQATMAKAVADSQTASANLQVSKDALSAKALETAAATHIADVQAQSTVAVAQIAANATTYDSTTAATADMFKTVAQILPTTQRQALGAGQSVDTAGFSLQQMFQNLLNFQKTGTMGAQTLVSSTGGATSVAGVNSSGGIDSVSTVSQGSRGVTYTMKDLLTGSGNTSSIDYESNQPGTRLVSNANLGA